MFMSRWYLLALAAIPLLLSLMRPAPVPELHWWTTGSLEKIHPSDTMPANAAHVAKIQAARNEFEPFQLALRAQGQNLENVDVEVSNLQGKTEIPSEKYVSIYFEQYVTLTRPSSVTGGTGEWPDPLIPRIDRYANEKRNAFPFKLESDRTQPVWIDVYVPPETPGGTYRGEVRVTVAGKPQIIVPIELEVWNFELPSTSSLMNAFGFSGNAAERAHYGKYRDDKGVVDTTYMYAKAALLHRVTLDGSASISPIIKLNGNDVQLGWNEYDDLIAPFMDGRVFAAGEPLYGAKATSVAIHTPALLLTTPEQQVQFWRKIAQHFREKGWFDRLIDYLWDEPKAPSYQAMAELGRTIHKADPGLRNLVTAPFHADWSDFIDIWSPPINCFERKPHQRDFCNPMVDRTTYQPELSKGKQLWWYQACGSHGCGVIGGEYFRGWPSYMIDDAPVRNRIMEWLTWKYGIQGELYYSMDEAFSRKPDPWKDVNLYSGNGDGTLFYPGRPQVIGGTQQIPIESIRLKLIREGLEDYEYLALLTKLAGYKAVSDGITGLLTNTYEYDQEPVKLTLAREWMGREITRRLSK
jgi:hypothetical protein